LVSCKIVSAFAIEACFHHGMGSHKSNCIGGVNGMAFL
jgi:hypothetical protein